MTIYVLKAPLQHERKATASLLCLDILYIHSLASYLYKQGIYIEFGLNNVKWLRN